jgi:hypothetical protein
MGASLLVDQCLGIGRASLKTALATLGLREQVENLLQ